MIDTRCTADGALRWRPGDTPETVDEIVRHNFGYECACSPAPPPQCEAARLSDSARDGTENRGS